MFNTHALLRASPIVRNYVPQQLGINENLEVSRLVNTIVVICALMLMLSLVNLISTAVTDTANHRLALGYFVGWLCGPCVLVYCGWSGALQRDRRRLKCFCCCSLACGICTFFAVVVSSALVFVTIYAIGDYPDCQLVDPLDDSDTGGSVCYCCPRNYTITNAQSRSQCFEVPDIQFTDLKKDCNSNDFTSGSNLFLALAIVGFLQCLLFCCAFCKARELRNHRYFVLDKTTDQDFSSHASQVANTRKLTLSIQWVLSI